MQQSKNKLCQVTILAVLFSIWIHPYTLICQTNTIADIPMYWDGKQLNSAFAGGHIAPQVNAIDLNNDGLDDLLVFDRVGDIAITYIYDPVAESYIYDPYYKSLLPKLLKWVIVRDYNNDAVPDLFTGSVVGNFNAISVYKGSLVDDELQFELIYKENEDALLYYEKFGELKEVYNSIVDKPEIIDFDKDGDMDIISFGSGGNKVYYYENQTIQDQVDYDEFPYILADDCFGRFEESGLSEAILLSTSPTLCYEPLIGEEEIELRHSGSTITCFDIEGDGDYDLLIGDLLSNTIAYLHNAGENGNVWMDSVAYDFPSETVSANMPEFLSAFVLDINKDGNEDVLVVPNGESNVANVSNIWYYENLAETGFELSLVKKNLLKDEMIDLGTFAIPRFVDVNADGLIDMVIGTRGENTDNLKDQSRLVYFQNIGTATEPAYAMTDFDFGLYNQYGEVSFDFSPAFGDLDGDGDEDMVVGDHNGFLYYSENIAGAGNPMAFAQAVYKYMDINPGTNSRPEIFDLNADGLGDLIIGERNGNTWNDRIGSINYFQNIGTVGSPMFNPDVKVEPNSPTLGGVVIKGSGESNAFSSPIFYESADSLYLFSGSQFRGVHMYSNILNNITGIFDTVEITFRGIIEGDITIVDVAELDNDGFLEMVIGNERGGIAIYNTDLRVNGEVSSTNQVKEDKWQVAAYPNPSRQDLYIESFVEIQSITIFDLQGKKLAQYFPNSKTSRIPTDGLASGLHIAQLVSESGETKAISFAKL